MKLLQGLSLVTQILAGLIPVGADVFEAIADASKDGKITPDEGEEIGEAVFAKPDVKAKIRGVDVLDERVEALFGRALGRAATLAFNALT